MAKHFPSSSRRRLIGLAIATAALGSSNVLAQTSGTFTPSVGQAGKDVVWVPTPDSLVNRMLKLARVTPQDYVVDLGAGDGKIVIAAARDFKARALGIEYNPDMVTLAQRYAREAGVTNLATIRQGDIFASNFSDATVVTMYLLPQLNLRLRHTLLAMKPGTRLVSHQFTMGEWESDETSTVDGRPGHLWIVPANAGGDWTLRFPAASGPATAELSITQRFQRIRGDVELQGRINSTLRAPLLDGARITFGFTDAQGEPRRFVGTIDGNRMQGTVSSGAGDMPFSAERRGAAPPIGGSEPVSAADAASGRSF